MPTKVTRKELEKFRHCLKQHINNLEARNKELRRKQFFTEKLVDKLREQEFKLSEKINHLKNAETPFLQVESISIKNENKKSIKLYLN